jgi:hypothetical protein
MYKVLEAIEKMSKDGYVVVEDSLIEEIGEILYGLRVNYTITKVDKHYSSLILD